MIFGFDSAVAFSKSVARIDDKALELPNHLSAKRPPATPGAPSKPIVFLYHRLGEIMGKRAPIVANERDSNLNYKEILDNTRGIAFMGVPYQGSDSASWASFSANLLKSASIGNPSTPLLCKIGEEFHYFSHEFQLIC